VGINHIRLFYHLMTSREIIGEIPFNPLYQDLDVIPLLQEISGIAQPLVITSLLWDWRTRTLEVWVKEEKAR